MSFYVTTPIYYVNALPHLGTVYSTVVADALARYHRARGHETFFLTGLDEHGQKVERIARERGLEPQAYCDGVAAQFQESWKRFEIENQDFIRTTEPRHEKAVAEMWRRLKDKGDIYEAEYDGMYCVGCEEAKTRTTSSRRTARRSARSTCGPSSASRRKTTSSSCRAMRTS
jgi:methionyl-tRNA synthetase